MFFFSVFAPLVLNVSHWLFQYCHYCRCIMGTGTCQNYSDPVPVVLDSKCSTRRWVGDPDCATGRHSRSHLSQEPPQCPVWQPRRHCRSGHAHSQVQVSNGPRVADPVHFRPDPFPANQNFKKWIRILLEIKYNQFKHHFFSSWQSDFFRYFYVDFFTLKIKTFTWK